MINTACLEFVAPLLNGVGWLAATIIGAMIGFYSNQVTSRRSAVLHIRGRILAILDVAPTEALDLFDKNVVSDLRGDFFAAVVHLGELDKSKATERWNALKQIPLELPDTDPDSFISRFRRFRDETDITRSHAFHTVMKDLHDIFAAHSNRLRP